VTLTRTTEPLTVRVETAAHMLDAPYSTVITWIKAGYLPGSRKIGRSWRVPVSAINALADTTASVAS